MKKLSFVSIVSFVLGLGHKDKNNQIYNGLSHEHKIEFNSAYFADLVT